MLQLNLIGGGFQHAYSSCGWEHPTYVVWNKTDHSSHISVHVDDAIFNIKPNPEKTNVAWFCESPFFTRPYSSTIDNPNVKNWLLTTYKYVFTSDVEVIEKHPELIYVPPHALAWVEEKRIFPKTKLISIIASSKKDAPGHKLRHDIINSYGEFTDVYGFGYKPIRSKNEGLNDYMFSFAIENFQAKGYFTEKISDCFATGTIPIYWGDPLIYNNFDKDGIIILDDLNENNLTPEYYYSKIAAIRTNLSRVTELEIPEDYMYLKYFKQYE